MNFEGFAPLRLTEEEYDILKTLRCLADRSGFEYGIAAQLRERTTGKILWKSEAFTSHADAYVDIPAAVLARDTISLYHAHTNNTLFSVQDLRLLVTGNIEKICVISTSCDIAVASIGMGYRPDTVEFEETSRQISRAVDLELSRDPHFWDWTRKERVYHAILEQAYQIARYFKWTLEGGHYVYESV